MIANIPEKLSIAFICYNEEKDIKKIEVLWETLDELPGWTEVMEHWQKESEGVVNYLRRVISFKKE